MKETQNKNLKIQYLSGQNETLVKEFVAEELIKTFRGKLDYGQQKSRR